MPNFGMPNLDSVNFCLTVVQNFCTTEYRLSKKPFCIFLLFEFVDQSLKTQANVHYLERAGCRGVRNLLRAARRGRKRARGLPVGLRS